MVNINDYFNEEHGLLQPNLKLPVYVQHNILQVTGLALASGLVNNQLKSALFKRYEAFWEDIRFIPRTISFEWHEDMGKEAKGDIWKDIRDWDAPRVVTRHETSFDDGTVGVTVGSEMPIKYYINIAVSHSQLMYFLMGLWYSGHQDFAKEIMAHIVMDNWRIKWQGETVPNGSMNVPYGNLAYKVAIISKILGIRLLPFNMASWFLKPWWHKWLAGDDLIGAFLWTKWGNDVGLDAPFYRGNDVQKLVNANMDNSYPSDKLKNWLNLALVNKWL